MRRPGTETVRSTGPALSAGRWLADLELPDGRLASQVPIAEGLGGTLRAD